MSRAFQQRILILGGSGMLGFALHKYLTGKDLAVAGTVRSAAFTSHPACSGLDYVPNVDVRELGSVLQAVDEFRPTLIINAAAVKHASPAELMTMFNINSAFPRRLAHITRERGIRLIHFSTDGVFDGCSGAYDEASLPNPADPYSLSKFLGEPSAKGALTIRTSMIGRAIGSDTNLVDWVLKQRGGCISGYSNVIFSGLPVSEIAAFLYRQVIAPGNFQEGLFHLAAPSIDKMSLIRMIIGRWGIEDIVLIKDEAPRLNRSLKTLREMDFGLYRAPGWPRMIDEMYQFYEEAGLCRERSQNRNRC